MSNTGHKNIYLNWRDNGKPYRVIVTINKKSVGLGYFATIEDAKERLSTHKPERNPNPSHLLFASRAKELASKGGKARAKKLTSKQRKEISKLGATIRWNKPKENFHEDYPSSHVPNYHNQNIKTS